MNHKIVIWVDDIRPNPYLNLNKEKYRVFSATNFNEAVRVIYFYSNHNPIFIDLDHDLGEKLTGYDICKVIVEEQIAENMLTFSLHTSNPVGRENMRQLLTHYGYQEVK